MLLIMNEIPNNYKFIKTEKSMLIASDNVAVINRM